MFAIGVFNANNGPKQSPGSCTVLRPNGPGTISPISLQGTCNNGEPEYVGLFSGDSYAVSNSVAALNGASQYTITAWINPTNAPTSSGEWIYSLGSPSGAAILQFEVYTSDQLRIGDYNKGAGAWVYANTAQLIPFNQWTFVAVTLQNGGVNTGTYDLYINGNMVTSASGQSANWPNGNYIMLGGNVGGIYGGQVTDYYTGSIANLQTYKQALGSNTIQQMYYRGIGGAPLNLNYLDTWYPLNGDIYDYSGNGRNFTTSSANIIFTQNWQSGYNIP